MSGVIKQLLKDSIGQIVGFWTLDGYYFQGEVLDCDESFLKYKDRKSGIKVLSLSLIKEVSIK